MFSLQRANLGHHHDVLCVLTSTYMCTYSTDKICDQISDAVLDAHLKQDPDAKVACGKSFKGKPN